MNVLNRFTLENLKKNKKRTIVTTIGVALSTALICAVAGMVMSFQKSLVNMVKKEVGDYNIVYENIPADQLKYIENNINIKDNSYMYSKNLGYSILKNSENEYKPYLNLIAMDKKSLNNNGLQLIEGRLPENENEIIISEYIKINAKVKYNVGDTLTLDVGKRLSKDGKALTQEDAYLKDEIPESITNTKTNTYKVVGIVERPNNVLEDHNAPGYTVITYLDETIVKNSISNNKEDCYNISVLFKNVKDYNNINKEIVNVLKTNIGQDVRFTLNKDLIRFEGGLSDSSLNALYSLAAIIMVIIIVSSVFVIRNSFSISVSEKNKQYGMMASVGATSKQIKKSVLFEGFLIGLLGIPIGIICGIIAIIILIAIVNILLVDMLNGIRFVYTIPISVILLTIVLASITIYLSGIIPARRASKISPIDSIRGKDDIKMKAKKVRTSKLTNKIFGIGGVIASKNLKRSKKKYRTTVISLVVSVSIFIALSSFLQYGKKITGTYYTGIDYNISVCGLNTKQYEKIKKMDTVENFAITDTCENSIKLDIDKYCTEFGKQKYKEIAKYNKSSEDIKEASITIIKYNNEYFKEFIKKLGLNESDYNKIAILEDDDIYYDTKNKKSIEHYYNIKKGQTIYGKIDEKDFNIKISEISTQRPMGMEASYYNGGLIIVSEDYKLNNNAISSSSLYIKSSDSQKLEDEITKLKKNDEKYFNLSVSNLDTYKQQSDRIMLLVSIFLYGFIAVITLIGVTNIFNTITTNMILRSKEFAMLKSIGMTTKEFNKMIRLESILYGFKSLIIGIPIGTLGSFGIYKSFSQDLDFGYMFPWIPTLVAIVFVFIIVGFTMKYSLNKINKQNIVETIRKDNI